MQQLMLDVWARFRATVIFVTHDIDEALLLGDRIVLLAGRPSTVELMSMPERHGRKGLPA